MRLGHDAASMLTIQSMLATAIGATGQVPEARKLFEEVLAEQIETLARGGGWC